MSIDLIRKAAENDLLSFIKIMAPHRVLGSIHEDVIDWWTREERGDHQLLLMPRDHQKSALIAYRVAWEITKNPATTVLYISATSTLAEKQLYFIKNILSSKQYRRYWPHMIHEEEGKREKWTEREICVDHPKRKEEGIRDSTLFTAGLTTTITGLHFNIAVLDDVVIKENAYTAEGRNKVKEQYSLLASIETTGAQEWIVGTRYHPKDLYTDLIQMEKDVYDKDGQLVEKVPVYEVLQKQVEDIGDGTGEFLWPRQQRGDGKWFGFDANILAGKRAKYLDKTQFRAQYYNDPNDPSNDFIDRSRFQYYNKSAIVNHYGDWFHKEYKLNVYAAIDFAFSKSRRADFTSIVVIGIDKDKSVYILDIARFKTDKISEYFRQIRDLHIKWGFRKLRAETSVAQKVIVRELKDYIQKDGLYLSVDENSPTRHNGSKEERIAAILEPRYDNLGIWHYKGGNCEILEEELILAHPPHDDIKDALAAVVEIAIPPISRGANIKQEKRVSFHPKFGGAY
jgi:hypothetical protein